MDLCGCGDPCCRRCFPGSYLSARAYDHHDDHAEQWLPDKCPICQGNHEEHAEEGASLGEGILACWICEAWHVFCREEMDDCPLCKKERDRESEPDDYNPDILSDREADDLAMGYIAERFQDR
jgi:hypothetical protein